MNGRLRNMATIYLRNGDRLLLLYRVGSRVVPPSWCGIGGHFEPRELNDARACALREMGEEIGLREGDLQNLALRYITLSHRPGEIRQNYYFFADLRPGASVTLACDEGQPAWVALDAMDELKMPFSARYMLDHYRAVGQRDDKLYAGIATPGGVSFTEMREF